MEGEALKYPVGKYQYVIPDEEVWTQWISTIETLPEKLKKVVSTLSFEDLEKTYRPEGWNVKQIVHHLADSHMNSFIRFKLVLTEENPTIKPYNEAEWAKTEDACSEDVADSLDLLTGLHKRWTTFLKSIKPEDRTRTFVHPEYGNQYDLNWMLGLYEWHCRHHLAHIQMAIDSK